MNSQKVVGMNSVILQKHYPISADHLLIHHLFNSGERPENPVDEGQTHTFLYTL